MNASNNDYWVDEPFAVRNGSIPLAFWAIQTCRFGTRGLQTDAQQWYETVLFPPLRAC